MNADDADLEAAVLALARPVAEQCERQELGYLLIVCRQSDHRWMVSSSNIVRPEDRRDFAARWVLQAEVGRVVDYAKGDPS